MISLLGCLSGDKMVKGDKVRVTKCPGNGSRAFTVVGDLDFEIKIDESLSISGIESWLLTSSIKRIENYPHAKNHVVVYTENSVYVVEKLNE